jgi:DNA-binding TFAR19-related protein (PDSD5 family)
MDEDKELEYLKARKMLQLRKRIAGLDKNQAHEKSNRDILISRLVDRGFEVLRIAEKYYPEKTENIVNVLAEQIRKQNIKGNVTGGELLGLFRQLGLNIHVKTSIQVQKDGKFIPLTEKLKSDD